MSSLGLLGLSPASANVYSWDVGFAIENDAVTGNIVTDCISCILGPSDFVSWSFMLNGGDAISSSSANSGIQSFQSPGYPLPLLASHSIPPVPGIYNIFFENTSSPNSYIQFCSGGSSTLCGADSFSLIFSANYDFPISSSSFISYNLGCDALPGCGTVTSEEASSPLGIAVTSVSVPEPSTWAMMLLGFAGLGFAGYRRGAKARPVVV